MLPEGRKLGQFLLDRKLQVMARHALVISNCLDLGQLAMLEVAGVYVNPSRTRAVWRPFKIARRGGLFFTERLDRHDLKFGFRKQPEQLRQLRLHLRDVMAVRVHDFVA